MEINYDKYKKELERVRMGNPVSFDSDFLEEHPNVNEEEEETLRDKELLVEELEDAIEHNNR